MSWVIWIPRKRNYTLSGITVLRDTCRNRYQKRHLVFTILPTMHHRHVHSRHIVSVEERLAGQNEHFQACRRPIAYSSDHITFTEDMEDTVMCRWDSKEYSFNSLNSSCQCKHHAGWWLRVGYLLLISWASATSPTHHPRQKSLHDVLVLVDTYSRFGTCHDYQQTSLCRSFSELHGPLMTRWN